MSCTSSSTKRDVERTDKSYLLNTQCANALFQRKKSRVNFILLKSYQYFMYGRERQFLSATLQTQK